MAKAGGLTEIGVMTLFVREDPGTDSPSPCLGSVLRYLGCRVHSFRGLAGFSVCSEFPCCRFVIGDAKGCQSKRQGLVGVFKCMGCKLGSRWFASFLFDVCLMGRLLVFLLWEDLGESFWFLGLGDAECVGLVFGGVDYRFLDWTVGKSWTSV